MSGTRTRLPASERRAVILDSGAELFAARGYDGVTLEQVAGAAGVTKPIVYRHFASKEELYLALLGKHADDMPSFVDLPPDEDVAPRLHDIVDTWFAYARRHPHGWQMLFRDAGGSAEIAEFRRLIRGRARAILAGFLQRANGGEIPLEELEPLAELLRGGLSSLVLWWDEYPEAPREHLVAAAERLIAPLVGIPLHPAPADCDRLA